MKTLRICKLLITIYILKIYGPKKPICGHKPVYCLLNPAGYVYAERKKCLIKPANKTQNLIRVASGSWIPWIRWIVFEL